MAHPILEAEQLNEDAKRWLANAIAGMITADKSIVQTEVEYLRQAIGFLDNREEANTLMEMVKQKKQPNLHVLRGVERTLAVKILMSLAEVTVTDDKLTKSEVEFFVYAAKKLGFTSAFAQKVMKWAYSYLEAKRHRDSLLLEAESTLPTFDQ